MIVIGPMAPMLAHAIESVTGADAFVTVRRCRDWSHLGSAVDGDEQPFVVVGIDEEFDWVQAHQLSLECPNARIIACELHAAELSVMRGGRVQRAGAATPRALARMLGLESAG